ncbi:hypothetical protein SAMN04487905_11148 [Actinopolyspora xinjiangensis]|uniref:Uncharacterized protein n=1 Tax=Actinopolyspora xinjiangensis TaxID=405564 RepID=A0A1H0W8F6_9ACTN|nr:hypothetical protein SAMN04487905_11148 [Actinopolyspora xinjiangensis]
MWVGRDEPLSPSRSKNAGAARPSNKGTFAAVRGRHFRDTTEPRRLISSPGIATATARTATTRRRVIEAA